MAWLHVQIRGQDANAQGQLDEQDALLMLVLPIPILGTVLLYLDIRRQSEGLDDRALRAALDA